MEKLWQWLVWFLLHWITRYVASWLLALGLGAFVLYWGWHAFDDGNRNDGNSGHATIDFGGQWLMGAMLLRGHGQDLYIRGYQRQVLVDAYPYDDETPDKNRPDDEKGRRDAGSLMTWFMGQDDDEGDRVTGSLLTPLAASDPFGGAALLIAGHEEWTPKNLERAGKAHIGGPLYPPINAFFYAPLGLLDPRTGYRVNQLLCLGYAAIAGLGVSYMSRGRFWWPLATALIIVYPGFKGALHLGQNPPLTLLLLIWGWALVVRDRPILGGILWGFLAFKPVWALAFFLVPFLTMRWRMALAMASTGIGLAAATLPFVGLHSWRQWLAVGKDASELYKTDTNWVFLSRDVFGIPRRLMGDFVNPGGNHDPTGATECGYGLLLAIVVATALLATIRLGQARRATTGPIAAFVLLGAWLSCFHFMYYDILLTALPLFVLFAEPRRYLDPLFVAIVPLRTGERLGDDFARYYRAGPAYDHPPSVPLLQADYPHIWVVNRMVPNVLALFLLIEHALPHFTFHFSASGTLIGTVMEGRIFTTALWHHGQPWDTFLAIYLWLYCGLLWILTPRRQKRRILPGSPDADVLLASDDPAAQTIELETHVRGGHQNLTDQYRPDASRLQP